MLTVTYCHPKEGKAGKPHPCKTFASYLNSEGRRKAPGDSGSGWDGSGEQGGSLGHCWGPATSPGRQGRSCALNTPAPTFC